MIGKPRQVIEACGAKTLTESAAQAELGTALAAAHWGPGQYKKAALTIDAALRAGPDSAVAAIEKARMKAPDHERRIARATRKHARRIWGWKSTFGRTVRRSAETGHGFRVKVQVMSRARSTDGLGLVSIP